jgi:hypothetical protein
MNPLSLALVTAAALAAVGFTGVPGAAAPVPKRGTSALLVVESSRPLILRPDGQAPEQLPDGLCNGALSPDGRWLASTKFELDPNRPGGTPPGRAILHSRTGDEPITFPLAFGQPGTGCLYVWSADSRRVLVNETGQVGGQLRNVNRIYDLTTRKVTELAVPAGVFIRDWSPDGKRFLADISFAGNYRIGWINADGTGGPESLTAEGEVAYQGRLSPDGKKILFLTGDRPRIAETAKVRLTVMDLATRKRTVVDEPGETYGHCWAPDGSRVAYTWQRSLKKPGAVPKRETILFTCDPDGRDRKKITSRTYEVPENSSGKDSVVYFFWVADWR